MLQKSLYNHCFLSLMIFFKLFFYFSSLDLLTKVYSWQEKNRCNTQAEGQKIVNWHKNEGFPVVSKGKGWSYCTSNLEHTLLTFLLLTVYHLFIWHKIFKDLIDRNISNLGQVGIQIYFGQGEGKSYIWDRVLVGKT